MWLEGGNKSGASGEPSRSYIVPITMDHVRSCSKMLLLNAVSFALLFDLDYGLLWLWKEALCESDVAPITTDHVSSFRKKVVFLALLMFFCSV